MYSDIDMKIASNIMHLCQTHDNNKQTNKIDKREKNHTHMDEQYNTKDDDDWEMNSGLYLTQFLPLDIYVYTTHTGNQFLIQSYLLIVYF